MKAKPALPAGQSADPPFEAHALEKSISDFLNTPLDVASAQLEGTGDQPPPKTVGACKFGVYAFFDYDCEPIYVGQTRERLSTRIRRHLTGQRSDAVAKGVLDPYEVRKIQVWPVPGGQNVRRKEDRDVWQSIILYLDRLEAAVYLRLTAESLHQVMLNEAAPKLVGDVAPRIEEQPYSGEIVNREVYKLRSHIDTRIARRCTTLARLAQNISERHASAGLRSALLAQVRRLEWLAKRRLDFIASKDEERG